MGSVTTLAGKAPSSSDFAKPAKADAGTGFRAVIAGASEPTARNAASSRTLRSGDKAPHAKRDDDAVRDDADVAAVADGSTPAPSPLPTAAAVATDAAPAASSKPASDIPQRVALGVAASSASATDAAIDLTQTSVDPTDATLAPVLAALADSLAAKQAGDPPVAAAAADPGPAADTPAVAVATPTTATAALMASRIAPATTPFSSRADARVPAANRKPDDDADADSTAATLDPTASSAATPIPVSTTVTVAANAHTSVADGAARQLATGAADRQLDLAKQGAWLDGIAHDIAATGAGTGPLRFEVAPQHLGAVQVEMTRDAIGTTVTLTASSEASRVALADARPQLIAEAGRHGFHIASAQVDVGGGQAGADSRSSSNQGDSRQSASSNGSFSAQANAQGDSGRQSQTRSQPSAANPVPNPGAPDADAAPEPADGLYA